MKRGPVSAPERSSKERSIFQRVNRDAVYPERLPLPPLRDQPDNGLARTPPMGWNSWNQYHDKFDDATVRQMADAMVSSGMARPATNTSSSTKAGPATATPTAISPATRDFLT